MGVGGPPRGSVIDREFAYGRAPEKSALGRGGGGGGIFQIKKLYIIGPRENIPTKHKKYFSIRQNKNSIHIVSHFVALIPSNING